MVAGNGFGVPLFLDVERFAHSVTRGPVVKTDMNGVIKTDRETKVDLYTVQLLRQGPEGGEVVTVTVPGEPAGCTVGTQVHPADLEAIFWQQNGKAGIAYRASSITVVAAKATAVRGSASPAPVTSAASSGSAA